MGTVSLVQWGPLETISVIDASHSEAIDEAKNNSALAEFHRRS
jgi:hypothetical protein